jgi:type IV secretion system protein VirB9
MKKNQRSPAFFWAFGMLFLGSAVVLPPVAQAMQNPRPIATDGRIRTVRYSPNEVYNYTGHYGFQSLVEFSPEEEILNVSVGDSVAWQVVPSGNKLFLKPVEQDALTNMTVVTSRGMYHFELHAEETENIRDKDMIFVLRFLYPDDQGHGVSGYGGEAGVPDLSDPEVVNKLNFNYTIAGPETSAPIRVFDDGEFTYFQCRDRNAEVPAFFYVDPDGSEGILNFRTVGDYIVVERVIPVFTLRNGPNVLCVFNEAMPLPPRTSPVTEGDWLRRNFGI